jgi:hypothetical protein
VLIECLRWGRRSMGDLKFFIRKSRRKQLSVEWVYSISFLRLETRKKNLNQTHTENLMILKNLIQILHFDNLTGKDRPNSKKTMLNRPHLSYFLETFDVMELERDHCCDQKRTKQSQRKRFSSTER